MSCNEWQCYEMLLVKDGQVFWAQLRHDIPILAHAMCCFSEPLNMKTGSFYIIALPQLKTIFLCHQTFKIR
jgi:hypothetical protein